MCERCIVFISMRPGSARREGSAPNDECRTDADCTTGECAPQWSAQNFTFTLSPNQPFGWVVSGGAAPAVAPGADGIVPPVNADYFLGELKCIEVNNAADELPLNANDLIGNATIYKVDAGTSFDVQAYNAVGIQALSEDGSAQSDTIMCLGETTGSADCATAEYGQCPSKLLLDHWFHGAQVSDTQTVEPSVAFVPCSQNIAELEPAELVLQFLVFNEFEQRLSGSTTVECYRESLLANLDKRAGQEDFSIFSASVQGTLTGLTHVRAVVGGSSEQGYGVLAIGEDLLIDSAEGRNAFNVHYAGVNDGVGDVVRYESLTGP